MCCRFGYTRSTLHGVDSGRRSLFARLPEGDAGPSRYERLIQRILRGQSDADIRFADLRTLMRRMGFVERIRGSHHVYRKQGVTEKINLQSDDGNAKPYQVRQVRRLIHKYKLGNDE